MKRNRLIVLLGPTGVGKTELSLQLAETFNSSIISSDSRQFFKELKIGTAAPTREQLDRVKHYFIGVKSITDYYSAGQYEVDVLQLLNELFAENSTQFLVGGSMLYIDAVCNGLDELPPVSTEIRNKVLAIWNESGINGIGQKLQELDPACYKTIDINNKQRVIHAIEVSLSTGKPYSELLKHEKKERPFDIIKIGLNLPREELYQRINQRVDIMIENGLIQEVESLYPYKHLNALNTVGYKELFQYMDGKYSLDFAINMIKQNSRRYAKRQLTWFNADKEIQWFNPKQPVEISATLEKRTL
ncbi:MAG: tRNA (adenosine(37)-N6)-dimethylallyltransferase MiaA [Paludibacteraceae bacterium]|nr:tRNA (adenosine(37)-N6)-dimethylallyltransferase MiaA [Paludibacteraceae bacterium]